MNHKPQPVEPILLTTAQVAATLSMSISTVKAKITTGEIPSLKIGGLRRVAAEDLRQWVDEQREQARLENLKPEPLPDFIQQLMPKPKRRKKRA